MDAIAVDITRLPDWRFAAARGGVALALGLAVLLWPALALDTVLFAVALVALVYGVVTLLSWPGLSGSACVLALVEGSAGVALAVLVFVWPVAAGAAATWAVALWAGAIGGAQVAVAVARRDAIADEWLQAVSGAAMFLFALVLAVRPHAGGAFATVVAANVVALGLLAAAIAFEVRRRFRPAREN